MNRPIKFRFKHKLDPEGQWEYLLFEEMMDWESMKEKEIDLETVCEYTGLKDKNGKEIYEGDIIKTKTGIREVKWGTSWAELNAEMEVIGNTYAKGRIY